MPEYTPTEVAQRYRATMGEDLGPVFYRLWNECGWLHLMWREYVTPFGTNKARLALLNKAAPGFARLVDDVLWDSVLLHISRMTDPPERGGKKKKETLTLRRLPELVADSIRPTVEKRLTVILKKVAFARDHRNRRIGHRDLLLALGDPSAKAVGQGQPKACEGRYRRYHGRPAEGRKPLL